MFVSTSLFVCFRGRADPPTLRMLSAPMQCTIYCIINKWNRLPAGDIRRSFWVVSGDVTSATKNRRWTKTWHRNTHSVPESWPGDPTNEYASNISASLPTLTPEHECRASFAFWRDRRRAVGGAYGPETDRGVWLKIEIESDSEFV